ncbi:MAG: hypothetical protein ACREDR_48215, partial [Blastocatellia bacterium]
WKTVTYRGVAIDVPDSWVVRPRHESCGVAVPTVFIGPAQPLSADCVALAYDASEVIMGGLQFGQPGRPVAKTLNGLKAQVTTNEDSFRGPLSTPIIYAAVKLPTVGVTISVFVGESSQVPGGAPGRAEQIVGTIHMASRAS